MNELLLLLLLLLLIFECIEWTVLNKCIESTVHCYYYYYYYFDNLLSLKYEAFGLSLVKILAKCSLEKPNANATHII